MHACKMCRKKGAQRNKWWGSLRNMEEDNVEQPLLEKKKKFYKNCPGCKVDEAKEMSEGHSVLFCWKFHID